MRNYHRLNEHVSLLNHKNMISKLIQCVMCLSEEVVLVLWTAESPFTETLSFIFKKTWLLNGASSFGEGEKAQQTRSQGLFRSDPFHQIYNISKSTCRTSGFRFFSSFSSLSTSAPKVSIIFSPCLSIKVSSSSGVFTS